MKYLIIISILLLVTYTTVLGYFITQQNKPITTTSSPSQSSDELISLKSQITKLQRELKEDILSNSAKIINLEKKVSISIANPSIQTQLESKEQPVNLPNPLLNQTILSELFKDPKFIPILQKQIAEIERVKQQNIELRKNLRRGIDIINRSKILDLTDYQKEECSKILTERVNKTIELSSEWQLSIEERRRKIQYLRNEANEKIKLILSWEQYEEFSETVNLDSDVIYKKQQSAD